MSKKQTAGVAVAPENAERLPVKKNTFGVRLKKSLVKYNWLYLFLVPTILFWTAIGWFAAAQNGQAGLRYASVGTVSVSGKGE